MSSAERDPKHTAHAHAHVHDHEPEYMAPIKERLFGDENAAGFRISNFAISNLDDATRRVPHAEVTGRVPGFQPAANLAALTINTADIFQRRR